MEHASPMACGACMAVPRDSAPIAANLVLSLPTAHCASCIAGVETTLLAQRGVRAARVNLTLRRVMIQAVPDTDPAPLIAALARAGYEAHEMDPHLLTGSERLGRDLAMRLGVAFFAMMNVMLLSVAVWAGGEGATRDLFHWISALIAIPTVAFAGQPFFTSALGALRAGRLGMDVPISLALILASAISLFETIKGGDHAYFDAAVMLCFFLLLGRYLDHRTRLIARSAAEHLSALEVPRAMVLLGEKEVARSISDIKINDLVVVRPGGRMPVDGVILQGTSEIDRSLLTGETLPVLAGPQTIVSAGEVNLTGILTVRVIAAGRDSSLHRMADLVAIAESTKTRYTSLAERAAGFYAPVVHLLSLAAFGFWMWQTAGDWRVAINIAAAVLIITCPCALGLAVPAVVTSASGKLFRKGLLIKDGTALERLALVDSVVMDKTGTLTMGSPQAVDFASHPEWAVQVALALAAGSNHPLARAIVAAASARPADITQITEVPGFGIKGIYRGQEVRLGRADWCGAPLVDMTATYLRVGDRTHAFTFEDQIRPGAKQAIAAFAAMGKTLYLVSGDAAAPVQDLAQRLGIDHWTAGALPAEKLQFIHDLNRQGRHVLMLGDGLNDTAALAAATVSISPATALDAARAASDIVLLGHEMSPIADALRIAKQARLRILQNFALAVIYNLIAVPLALAGIATPLMAALAMSASSITVSLNALRLK
jgi:P-type Cu2+ transporter